MNALNKIKEALHKENVTPDISIIELFANLIELIRKRLQVEHIPFEALLVVNTTEAVQDTQDIKRLLEELSSSECTTVKRSRKPFTIIEPYFFKEESEDEQEVLPTVDQEQQEFIDEQALTLFKTISYARKKPIETISKRLLCGHPYQITLYNVKKFLNNFDSDESREAYELFKSCDSIIEADRVKYLFSSADFLVNEGITAVEYPAGKRPALKSTCLYIR